MSKCFLYFQISLQTAFHKHEEQSLSNYPPQQQLQLTSESLRYPRTVTKTPYLFNILIEILQVFSAKLKRVLVFFITNCLTAAAHVGCTCMIKPGDRVFQKINIVKSQLPLVLQIEAVQSIPSSFLFLSPLFPPPPKKNSEIAKR